MIASRERRAPWRKNRSAIEPTMVAFRMGIPAPVAGRKVARMATATRAMVKRSGFRRERKAIDRALRMRFSGTMPKEAHILLVTQFHERRRLLQFKIADADLLPPGDGCSQSAI